VGGCLETKELCKQIPQEGYGMSPHTGQPDMMRRRRTGNRKHACVAGLERREEPRQGRCGPTNSEEGERKVGGPNNPGSTGVSLIG